MLSVEKTGYDCSGDDKYRLIIQNMINGFAYCRVVFDNDMPADFEILEVNAALERIFNKKREELEGKCISQIKTFDPHILDEIIKKCTCVIQTGEPLNFEQYFTSLDKWFLMTLYSNEKNYFSVIFHDITRQKKNEEQLVSMNMTYMKLFDDFPIPVCMTTADGNFNYFNKAWLDFTGKSWNGEKVSDWINEIYSEDRDVATQKIKFSCETREELTIEFRLHHKNGGYRWVTYHGNPFYNINNEFEGFIYSFYDIDENRRMNEKLDLMKNRLSEAQQVAHIGSWEINFINDSIYWSDELYRILGYKPDEMMPLKGLYEKHIYHDDLANVKQALDNMFIGCKCDIEHRINKKDGSVSWVHLKGRAEYDEHGKVTRAFGTIQDITRRVQDQERLNKMAAEYRTVFNGTQDSMFLIDVCDDGTFRYRRTNTAHQQSTGIPADMVKGKTLAEVLGEDTANKVMASYKACIKQVRTVSHEFTLNIKGETRIWHTTLSPIVQNGSVKQIVGCSRDITEEKQRREEIKYLSFHDKLTGTYNRAFMDEELKRLDTERQLPLSIIVGDVNGLKLTNDVFGHHEGDRLLQEVASILKQSCRSEDIISRWGGDEFAVILPQTSYEDSLKICERIREMCRLSANSPIQPSIALGSATKTSSSQNIHKIIKEAEDRMYRRKLLENRSVRSSIISSLEKTLFERNFETEEHAQRLVSSAMDLGRVLGLSENEMDELKLLSKLHDIGKIAIPDSILMKKGSLTPDEWHEMKKHSEIGYRIAQSSQELSHIAEYILTHHERWDGSGYPQGLRGQEIPKLSRILSVLDAYDVMTHARPYKEAMSREQALEELKRCSGSQFDPSIVEAFLKLNEDVK